MELRETQSGYRLLLLEELVDRKSRNTSYSLRAFARDLGVSTTTLSDVLAFKRHLSKKNALRVADRLALSPAQIQSVISEIEGREFSFAGEDAEYVQLREDTFATISEWYYFAILNLAKIPNNRADEVWIAERLGLSPVVVRSALARLERLNLITFRNGRLKRTGQSLSSTHDVPSSALRKFHKQNLERATYSIDHDSIDRRFINSVTMAIDPAQLEEAKAMIVRFRERMAALLEKGKPQEVYTLAIQLFPLTRKEIDS